MPIYLDHSATARVWPEVISKLASDLEQFYANPASVHRLGQAAEKLLNDSRQQIAAVLGCHKNELILTSGGSESINLAIKGYIGGNPRQGSRIISSCGEHAATSETLNHLRQQGCQCEQIALGSDGRVDLVALAKALEQPAAMISLIHVSNETGAVNDIAEIVRLRNRLQPQTAIHLDAVQSLGRQPFCFQKIGVELLSGSGHKIGAPKGIGWLIVRQGVRLSAQIHGGGQQRGLRSGTENPPMAAALAKAMQLTAADAAGKEALVRHLRSRLLDGLTAGQVNFRVLSPDNGVPQILLIAFPGLRGETLLHALDAKGIIISTGAACSAKQKKANLVLQSMGIPDKIAECAVRVSLSANNTIEEIDQTAAAIGESCRWLVR